ncbi:MAG: C69 family dipeptidase [Candidatus Latescibacterota bacterium]|nr:MAG: C69 family dipeptidase [Candidatus Latescibacterota bacterium]
MPHGLSYAKHHKNKLGIACVFAVVLLFVILPHEVAASATQSERSGCFMILVGKDATADGSVLLAHNNDLTGDEVSLIEKHPRAVHEEGATITFPSGLVIPQARETYEWLVMRIADGYAEGDAVAINEYQVAIAGGVALERDRNNRARQVDPLIKEGLTGGVRYVALQRAKTARECVEIVGELYSTYGVTYPSGFGVADPNEIWYVESGGGRTWAAVRIPDDRYWVQANGYRIGTLDVADSANVMVSKDLLEFCRTHRLWNPDDGAFCWRDAFGGRYIRTPGKEFYNRRRVWRGMDILSPSLGLDPAAIVYPGTAVPDAPVTLEQLFDILRDHYGGTRFDGYSAHDETSAGERLIASPTCVHTNVIQLRAGMSADVGAVLWAGLGRPFGTAYLPFYFGIDTIPAQYSITDAAEGAAFHIFKRLSDLMLGDYPRRSTKVIGIWEGVEKRCLEHQAQLESEARELDKKTPGSAGRRLTNYVSVLATEVLSEANHLIDEMSQNPTSHDAGSSGHH